MFSKIWVCLKVCLLFSLHTIFVFQVVSQRFRQHKTEAVATAIFLRFINPAISKLRKWKIWFSSLQIVYLPFIDVLDSPQMLGIVDQPPPDNIRRGLMFLSKVRSRNVFLSRKILFVYSTLTKFEVRYYEPRSLTDLELQPLFSLQILQSLANNVLFTKEKHMEPLNEFLKENLENNQQ